MSKGKVYKWITILLLGYVLVAGLAMPVPHLNILQESIRNLHFHVPLWFGMIILLGIAGYHSIQVLRDKGPSHDVWAVSATRVGMWFGVLGLITGMIWARYTWGEWWSGDPKQNASAIGLLLYAGYFSLRSAIPDPDRSARLSAVLNLISFPVLLALLFVLPRMTDSLHPGNGGNPGFNSYDLDSRLRSVFYPAVLAWTMLGYWLIELSARLTLLQNPSYEKAAKSTLAAAK